MLDTTPPGEAEYFEGGGLMKNIQESVERSKVCNSPVSQPPTPITPASSISTIKVGILPPAKVLADDLTKATLGEGSPNILKVTEIHGLENTKDGNCPSVQKDNTASSSRQGVSATCSSVPGSSGNAAGGSGHGPCRSKQEVSYDFADDPHQIIPTEEVFTVPSFP